MRASPLALATAALAHTLLAHSRLTLNWPVHTRQQPSPARALTARTPCMHLRAHARAVIMPAHLCAHLVTGKHTENKHELRYCRAPRFGSNTDLKWTRSSAVLHATSISNSTHGPTRHIDLLITNQARAMQTTTGPTAAHVYISTGSTHARPISTVPPPVSALTPALAHALLIALCPQAI